MPRDPRPWRRTASGAWYSTVRGVKVWLAPASASRSEASAALARALVDARAGRAIRTSSLTLKDCCNLYAAERIRKREAGEVAPAGVDGAIRILKAFTRAHGSTLAMDATPVLLESWLLDTARGKGTASGKPWGPSTRHRAGRIIIHMLGWCVRAGHLERNPCARARLPTPRKREYLLPIDDAAKLIEAADPATREFLRALLYTGCRPGEVARLTADRVDVAGGTWSVVDKIRGKTGEVYRTVYLSDEALELSRRMLARHPSGYVFRTPRGAKWICETWSSRIKLARAKAGLDARLTAYSFRHLYVTRMLIAGVPVATVAQLVGHRGIVMVLSVYSKLGQATEHLRAAARAGNATAPE